MKACCNTIIQHQVNFLVDLVSKIQVETEMGFGQTICGLTNWLYFHNKFLFLFFYNLFNMLGPV
jgi:hypothetical protein